MVVRLLCHASASSVWLGLLTCALAVEIPSQLVSMTISKWILCWICRAHMFTSIVFPRSHWVVMNAACRLPASVACHCHVHECQSHPAALRLCLDLLCIPCGRHLLQAMLARIKFPAFLYDCTWVLLWSCSTATLQLPAALGIEPEDDLFRL